MRQRLRSVVWRELPYSARRSIVGVLRAIDDFEDFWIRIWRSLDYSPAWLFVAAVGGLGIVLTIMLFCLLTQELMAGGPVKAAPKPILERAELVADSGLLDSRLCLDTPPVVLADYPAEFLHYNGIMVTDYAMPAERRPPTRRRIGAEPVSEPAPIARPAVPVAQPVEPAEPVDFPDLATIERRPPSRRPVVDAQPASDMNSDLNITVAEPDLQVEIQAWRQPATAPMPNTPERVTTAQSDSPQPPRLNWDSLGPWSWFKDRPVSQEPAPVAYAGDARLLPEAADEHAWDDFTAVPSRADVGLEVKLYGPVQATVQQRQTSRLVVRNTGDEPIRRVEIQEPIRWLDQVTAATPPAALKDGILYRELHKLAAGREKSLQLEWIPPAEGDRHHEARVLAEAFVAAYAEVAREPEHIAVEPRREPRAEPLPEPRFEPRPDPVPVPVPVDIPEPVPPRRSPIVTPPITVEPIEDFGPPPAAERPPVRTEPIVQQPAPPEPVAPRPAALDCRVAGKDRVAVRGVAEFEIDVVNSGETLLTGVRIWADLPENLLHRYGNRLQMELGDLRPGEHRVTVLRVVGAKIGLSRARIQAVSSETSSKDASAFLAVLPAETPGQRRPTSPGCACPCGPQVTFRLTTPSLLDN